MLTLSSTRELLQSIQVKLVRASTTLLYAKGKKSAWFGGTLNATIKKSRECKCISTKSWDLDEHACFFLLVILLGKK
jgi:hypothetical protein